jgi:hypothetical protein
MIEEGSWDDFGAQKESYTQARVKLLVNGEMLIRMLDRNPHMSLQNMAENLVAEYYNVTNGYCELIFIHNDEGNRTDEDPGPDNPADLLDGDVFDLYTDNSSMEELPFDLNDDGDPGGF